MPGYDGSLSSVTGLVGEAVTDAGAAARPGEDGAAVSGVAGRRRPVQVDHEVGHRRRGAGATS